MYINWNKIFRAVDFDGPVIGYAVVDTMCRSSCANVNFNSRKDAMFFGSVIAHELGHNFGMYHDSSGFLLLNTKLSFQGLHLPSALLEINFCTNADILTFPILPMATHEKGSL